MGPIPDRGMGKKYSDAVTLAAAIRGVVHALDLVSSPANMILQELDGIETLEGSLALYRRSIDAKIWFRESGYVKADPVRR